MKTLLHCLLFLLAAALPAAHAQNRDLTPPAEKKPDMSRKLALVIGNAAYADKPLNNAAADARLMEKTLKEFGFGVDLVLEADRTRMLEAIAAFSRKLEGAGVVLFYFAGHGIQIEGTNYLVPLKVDMDQETKIRHNAIKVDEILHDLGSAKGQLRIVILDACRNNPFKANRGGEGGLAAPGQAPFGTLIAYATSPGRVAADGERGKNGLYTTHLVEAMKQPGRALEEVFKVTRTRVAERSNGSQVPWETTSLTEGFFSFAGGAPAAPSAPQQNAGIPEAGLPRGLGVTARPRELPPKATFRDCANCPEMVVVPAGTFRMGSAEGEPQRQGVEGPQREVRIAAPFAVGRFEVTFEEWQACLFDKGGCDRWPHDKRGLRGKHPVTDVSWEDASRYVAWLSRHTGKKYRLLTEAEWEYVARAGSDLARPWGADIGSAKAHCDGCGGTRTGGPLEAGRTPPNAWAVHEMLGNVWEWVEDCQNPSYDKAPADGAPWIAGEKTDCSKRVLRGGSWTTSPHGVRSATRAFYPAGRRDANIGFRVATTLD